MINHILLVTGFLIVLAGSQAGAWATHQGCCGGIYFNGYFVCERSTRAECPTPYIFFEVSPPRRQCVPSDCVHPTRTPTCEPTRTSTPTASLTPSQTATSIFTVTATTTFTASATPTFTASMTPTSSAHWTKLEPFSCKENRLFHTALLSDPGNTGIHLLKSVSSL